MRAARRSLGCGSVAVRGGLVSGLVALALLGCDRTPRVVYVPASAQSVELDVRASATEVSVGDAVVLRAIRWNRGEWEKTRKRELAPDDCWMQRPPPEREAEVAANLQWTVAPGSGFRFNIEPRADHAREVVFERPGTFVLKPSSAIWCGSGEATGRPIRIVVRESAGEVERNQQEEKGSL